MWKSAVPWLAVFVCTAVILFQRTTITNLQRQLHSSSRVKRSSDSTQNVVFLPVFAQISRKAMHRMCLKRGYTGSDMIALDNSIAAAEVPEAATTTATITTTKMATKPTKMRRGERKRCLKDVTLSDPQLIGIRPNTVGAALRDGHAYYVTEFDLGYSILSFPSARSLNNSEPKGLFTLPYPFHGTDNTVFNRTAYYSYDNTVISFNMNTGDTKELRLNVSEAPLYKNSTSRMNIQADEHGLWVLYQRNGEPFLTATRIQPTSLKIISNWQLPAILPRRLCNAFIRCGLLYTVTCGVGYVTVSASYDFYAHMYVSTKQSEWTDMTSLSSVQYDPSSKSITIFDTGKIYTVTAV